MRLRFENLDFRYEPLPGHRVFATCGSLHRSHVCYMWVLYIVLSKSSATRKIFGKSPTCGHFAHGATCPQETNTLVHVHAAKHNAFQVQGQQFSWPIAGLTDREVA